jgi:transglutaminase-like putative cysteine protease
MDLLITHQTTYHYKIPPKRVGLLLRMWPASFDGQEVQDWTVTANDTPVSNFSTNSFGDNEAYVQFTDLSTQLVIEATGRVTTVDQNGLISGLKCSVPPAIYLRSTILTMPNDAIRALGQSLGNGDLLVRLHALSAAVRELVEYRSGITTSKTTAAEALALGKGVCQDHAHIFVTAARSLGVPARYVAGYYRPGDAEGTLHETHGWAEAMIDGLGWVGFDATNGVSTTDQYVRLCSGLDAHEAAPVRGAVFGTHQIGIDADVLISEASSSSHQQ